MNTTRRSAKLLSIVAASSIAIAACGSSDSSTDDTDSGDTGGSEETADTGGDEEAADTGGDEEAADTGGDEEAAASGAGGDFIDLGTFAGGPPEHLDPALNSTLNAYQVINALYDGLTEVDSSDPDNTQIVPLLAETVEANEDASVWTFTIKEGAQFSDGEEINASTFQNSWERVADLAGDYSYLLTFIEGGAERLAGEADTLAGVEADDETRTLTVTLDEPYSNFDAVAGFQLLFPMPAGAIEAGADYENEVMIGNGPYVMDAARTDQEIQLSRNENWQGDFNGETWSDRLDTITFQSSSDVETAYVAFEAGEGDNANIPPGRISDAEANYGTTSDQNVLGSYHFVINDRDERIGGDENLKLRQAISASIDREEINDSVYNGGRTTSTGIVPPGIPGFVEGICEYCAYDVEQAQTLFDEWVAEGGVQDGPIPIQFNADSGHEPVVAIMVDNMAAIGIEAEATPLPGETYFSELAGGACVICRAGWFADYPTYDNFMFDLFHSSALDGNNYGFTNDEFDALVDEAKQTTDADKQASLFQDAERVLLNDATMAIPMNWYKGSYAYDQERITNFPVTSFGLINWEQITVAS
ncbi:MAG: ABC transporter substrate-binding protein [Ilumatobacter sp.]|uniref:peptide ABC transporter substrate-binding protein n=1 Tax=Ilumatobacter sp. TaxID=1967498 RepID=UPI003C775498